MKKNITIFFAIILTSSLFAQDIDKKFSGWKQAETDHFKFVFEESARETTEGFAEIADEAWNKIAAIYGLPQDKTRVYVTDRTSVVNAFTYFSPIEIMMFTTPNMLTDFGFRDDWKKLFFTHELIHVANINFEDKLYLGSKLFGHFGHTIDMGFNYPAWAAEGLTTVLETELTDGGRGRSPYFELMYKAPTLDNAFISYSDIGKELEPPSGQGYVMGYLIARSIADRWGISALADIERNRNFFTSYEDSVFKVTGETPENIYRDVRIALAKKYAAERQIPEGKIISSRANKSYTYKPAIIMDDGTIIALRTNTASSVAVVKLNPSANAGSNYFEDSKPSKNLNTLMEETILFEGAFSDVNSVTADGNGIVYASLAYFRNDRFPGQEYEFPIYKWTPEKKLQKITKDVSLYMPSVSRDGSTLVAMKQKGQHFTLVKVDTETGAATEILSDNRFDFMQPSVNEDGTKIAFLRADGKRAAVCVCDISNPAEYKIVANGEGDIVDPIYPSWNSDGKLLYGCNTRGRLEIFEVSEAGGKTSEESFTNNDAASSDISQASLNSEKNQFISAPVLSDPIGALWAYKTERGIYYYSYSSSGYVIKIKPESEWGVVPENFGPSPAGEVISFGALENDYPDFEPYPKMAKRVVVDDAERKARMEKAKSENPFKKKDSENQIPVRDIEINAREDKFVEKVQNLPNPKTEFENEKRFVALPSPIMYFPSIGFISDPKDENKDYFGFGASLVYTMPKLQMANGIGLLNLNYYPSVNNFDFTSANIFPIGPIWVEISLMHLLQTTSSYSDTKMCMETNSLIAGLTIPVINRAESTISKNLSILALGNFATFRVDENIISLASPAEYNLQLFGEAGAEFSISKLIKKADYFLFDIMALGVGAWIPTDNKIYAGGEGTINFGYKSNYYKIDLGVTGRYFDLPGSASFPSSKVEYAGGGIGFLYPGRVVGEAKISAPLKFIPGFSLFCLAQKLLSFGTSAYNTNPPDNGTFLNATFDKTTFLAAGLSLEQNFFQMDFGVGCLLNTEKPFNMYFRVKMKWLGF